MGFDAPLEVVDVIIAKSDGENGQSFLSKDLIGGLLDDDIIIEEIDETPVEEPQVQQDIVVETEEIVSKEVVSGRVTI